MTPRASFAPVRFPLTLAAHSLFDRLPPVIRIASLRGVVGIASPQIALLTGGLAAAAAVSGRLAEGTVGRAVSNAMAGERTDGESTGTQQTQRGTEENTLVSVREAETMWPLTASQPQQIHSIKQHKST